MFLSYTSVYDGFFQPLQERLQLDVQRKVDERLQKARPQATYLWLFAQGDGSTIIHLALVDKTQVIVYYIYNHINTHNYTYYNIHISIN